MALDSAKWVKCNWDNWRQDECKSFTPDGIEINLKRNVSVRDGLLVLTTRREDYWSDLYGKWYQYTSGMVSTATRQYFRPPYYIEARIRFPYGAGLWGAWWATRKYEDGLPYQELDVVEQLGKDAASAYASFHQPEAGSLRIEGAWSEQWHTYGALLEVGRAAWFYDGVQVREFASPLIADYSMYLVLQQAVGGAWAGPPFGWDRVLTEVDYARVWGK